jgi:hypothetical protein
MLNNKIAQEYCLNYTYDGIYQSKMPLSNLTLRHSGYGCSFCRLQWQAGNPGTCTAPSRRSQHLSETCQSRLQHKVGPRAFIYFQRHVSERTVTRCVIT